MSIVNCQSTLTWRFWLDGLPRPGWQNMAIDLALLDLAAESGLAILRLYRWEPFCLSFGRHEPVLRRYGRDRIGALGVDVVRRPTGGRAVWHARELTYAVAAPISGALRQTYHSIHSMFAAALRGLGADANLAPEPRRMPVPGDGACFAAPVGGEVLVGGRKVLGSAQLRQSSAFLQHGSLLLEDDQQLVHRLAGEAADVAPELPLNQAVGRRVEFGEAAGAVQQAATDWTGPWEPLADSAAVLERANRHAARFRSTEWTWAR